LLDEIGDMSAFTQAKLLRVLQEKRIQRVGGKETISVDVRVIAATHRPGTAIREKRFREDLYRLGSFVIHLPLLYTGWKIPDLVTHFCGGSQPNRLSLPRFIPTPPPGFRNSRVPATCDSSPT
jgi:transcriptional regulator with GAF, ATPase, and Fis domain